jgi:hypothetical protein
MVMATTNLSQNRATQRLLRHRAAVATLARQAAIKAVKRQLQAQGIKLYSLSAKDIRVLADDYLAQHRARLIAEAKPDHRYIAALRTLALCRTQH